MSKKIKRTELDSYEVYILGLTILGENTEDEEVVRLATYIDETDFLIEDEPPKEVIRDYIDYFKKREISLEKLKEMLKIAIQEMDVEAQKQLLEQLKEYKK